MKTVNELKTIPVETVLQKYNIIPDRTTKQGKELWYLSPLHAEKTPSFKVDTIKNLWYDHAEGKGGTVIDIVMIIEKCSFADACNKLRNSHFSFTAPVVRKKEQKEDLIIVKKTQRLQNKALIQYLVTERGISIAYTNDLLNEIYYEHNSKNYFALAVLNNSGAWEIKNKYFKGSIGQKDITIVKGTENRNLAVFEGAFDYFSFLQLYKTKKQKDTVVILNSLSLISKLDKFVKENDFAEIKLFLDNDKAGEEKTKELLSKYKNAKDYRIYYKGYKDANDKLLDKKNNDR